MVFRRRNPLTWAEWIGASLYPRGGWGRATSYVLHRLRRLPDPPHKIARGIFVGVAVTFTPFYGLHFVMSVLLSIALRANILASLMATFIGNPLTYVPIAIISLQTGHFLLGTEFDANVDRSLLGKFFDAWADLFRNIWASFTGQQTDWNGLMVFYQEFILPFTVGGILPGIICGLICYYISVPLITAYQKRRLSRLRERAEKRLARRLKAEAAKKDRINDT